MFVAAVQLAAGADDDHDPADRLADRYQDLSWLGTLFEGVIHLKSTAMLFALAS